MSLHQVRYSYAHGFKSKRGAESALEDMLGDEISLGDDPQIESYLATMKGTGETVTRWRISLADTAATDYLQKKA